MSYNAQCDQTKIGVVYFSNTLFLGQVASAADSVLDPVTGPMKGRYPKCLSSTFCCESMLHGSSLKETGRLLRFSQTNAPASQLSKKDVFYLPLQRIHQELFPKVSKESKQLERRRLLKVFSSRLCAKPCLSPFASKSFLSKSSTASSYHNKKNCLMLCAFCNRPNNWIGKHYTSRLILPL